jgi:hypothetical protein
VGEEVCRLRQVVESRLYLGIEVVEGSVRDAGITNNALWRDLGKIVRVRRTNFQLLAQFAWEGGTYSAFILGTCRRRDPKRKERGEEEPTGCLHDCDSRQLCQVAGQSLDEKSVERRVSSSSIGSLEKPSHKSSQHRNKTIEAGM